MFIEKGMEMNIFPEVAHLWKFRATLGHKCNHSFKKKKIYFSHVYHPRYVYVRTYVHGMGSSQVYADSR